MRRTLTLLLNFVLSAAAILSPSATYGQANVNSQEQFRRLVPDGSPNPLHYNFDRAFLEVNPDEQYCPAASRAFFSLRINERGEVTKVSGRTLSLSAKLRSVTLKWAEGMLKEMRFRPLTYGNKPASVDMPVTVVCQLGQTVP